MTLRALPVLATIATIALVGTAIAADMTGAEIKELVSGKTVYLDLGAGATAGAGKGAIYYAADGTAFNKTPKGEVWQGPWSIKDNTICIDWKEVPNNPCSRYDKQGDKITVINVKTGQPRGTVAKTAAGNPDNIKP